MSKRQAGKRCIWAEKCMTSNDFQVWNERLQIWPNLYVCKIVSNWWAPYVKRGAPDFLYLEGGFCSFLDNLKIAKARAGMIRQSLHYLLCFRSFRGKVQITRPCGFCICSTSPQGHGATPKFFLGTLRNFRSIFNFRSLFWSPDSVFFILGFFEAFFAFISFFDAYQAS